MKPENSNSKVDSKGIKQTFFAKPGFWVFISLHVALTAGMQELVSVSQFAFARTLLSMLPCPTMSIR